MKPPRFTLQPRTWYAMEITFPHGNRHASPIWCIGVCPLKTGHRQMSLDFWHANYSEGAQHKVYELRILARQSGFLLGARDDSSESSVLLLTAITAEWISLHFPRLKHDKARDMNLQSWLDQRLGRPGHPARLL